MPCERVDSHLRFRALRFRLGLVVWLDELTQRGDSPVMVVPCGAGFQHYACLRLAVLIGPRFRGERARHDNRLAFLQRLADVLG